MSNARNESSAVFLSGSLMRHVVIMSSTASIGLMAIFAVDFIDIVFIAMLGNDALAAAVGYAGTVLFFTTSISIGLSIAAGALVARALGAGRSDEAREIASGVLGFGVLLSLLVVALVLIWMQPILDVLGASGEPHRLAQEYLRIIIPSMPVMATAMIASAVLRAHGDARRAMWATLAGGIVNAVFDPILIFVLEMGLQGAAWASVLARLTMLGAALLPVLRLYRGIAMPQLDPNRGFQTPPLGARERFFAVHTMLLAARLLIWLRRDIARIVGIAAPAILTNIATPVGTAIVMRTMASFGTDAVAAMAIIGRLTPVAFAMVFALSGAVGPIMAQNLGGKQYQRVRGTLNASLVFSMAYVVVVSLLLFLLRAPIASVFQAEGETLALLYLFCGPLALAFYFNAVIFVGNAAFNNLGHPFYSTAINWGRHTLGTYPFVIAGASIWGAAGVLIGQAVGGLMFAAVSVLMAYRTTSLSACQHYDKAAVKKPLWRSARQQILHWRRR